MSDPLNPNPPQFKIPRYTLSTDSWDYFYLQDNAAFREFLKPLFKEPGKYNISVAISKKFNEVGRFFNKNRYFCDAMEGSRDFRQYWDFEKEKCKEGVIYIDGNDAFYLPRDYYMWLNFLPIFNKELNDFSFPDIYDTQLHVAVYEKLAELHYKHCVILKKRQIAASITMQQNSLIYSILKKVQH